MEAQNTIENAQSNCDFTVDTLDLIAGIADVASIIDEPTEDEDIDRHSDSKVLAEEIRRKEAMGMRTWDEGIKRPLTTQQRVSQTPIPYLK